MPPWHADPKHGNSPTTASLSEGARRRCWPGSTHGCPEGDDKDLPPPRNFAEGWPIGKPDVVFTMPANPITVPAKSAKGGVAIQILRRSRPNFDEDKWVQAVEAKPGNHAVVHHIIVYVACRGKKDP